MSRPCPRCKGRGEATCGACMGDGETDEGPCEKCGGQGTLECSVCRGEGQVPDES
jgi:DnaJ-class molecular chaperone